MLAGKNLNSCPDSDSDETLTLVQIETGFQNADLKKNFAQRNSAQEAISSVARCTN